MASHLCTIISLLSAAVVPMLKAELTVNASPTTYTAGLSKNVKIECSFSRDPNTNLVFVTSLNLAHSKTTDNPEFQDLISITSFDSHVYGSVNTSQTQVYGVIDNKNQSFLGLVWKFPSVDRAGLYKCEATGLNKMGKHVFLSNSTNITALNPENSQVLELVHTLINKVERLEDEIKVTKSNNADLENKINQISNQTNNIQSQLNETNAKIYYLDDLKKLLENYQSLSNELNVVNNQLKESDENIRIVLQQIQMRMSVMNQHLGDIIRLNNILKSTFDTFEDAFLTPTPLYNGKRYWLTKNNSSVTPIWALLFCEFRGGYLAEIDSPEEYTFVRDNLLIRSDVDFVYISGSDEEQEGLWKHRNSKTVLTYLNWGTDENIDGSLGNCMAYFRGKNWLLVDILCPILTESHIGIGYLCEIPS